MVGERRTWTDGSAVRKFSSKLGKYESRTSGHFAAMAGESSTRIRTDSASPGMAGFEKEKEGGEVIARRLLEESRKGTCKEERRSNQDGMVQRGDMKCGGENP